MSVDPGAMAAAAAESPLRYGPGLSELADRDELRFREEIEDYPDPQRDIPRFIASKELVRKFEYALDESGLAPSGVAVDLGAGTCWMSATLARRPEVERVIAIEFSERRLRDLAPIAISFLEAPASKIERRVADFYAHGLGERVADWVAMDAAFHHAADPVRMARVAFDLLKPGGTFMLFREPTLSLLRRTRDHGIEDEHGSFEHEYFASGYLDALRSAGFTDVAKHRASGGWKTARARAVMRPPLSWFNGIAFAEYTYTGRRPA